MSNALILTALALSFVLPGQVQPSSQDPDWINNTKGAPLVLISQGYAISFRNRTKKIVGSYRLACVRATAEGFLVVRRFKVQHIPIPALGETTEAAFDGPTEEQVTCQNLNTKLSVLDATFKDGSTWHLISNSSSSSRDGSTKVPEAKQQQKSAQK
jgi:hypothetical protein